MLHENDIEYVRKLFHQHHYIMAGRLQICVNDYHKYTKFKRGEGKVLGTDHRFRKTNCRGVHKNRAQGGKARSLHKQLCSISVLFRQPYFFYPPRML